LPSVRPEATAWVSRSLSTMYFLTPDLQLVCAVRTEEHQVAGLGTAHHRTDDNHLAPDRSLGLGFDRGRNENPAPRPPLGDLLGRATRIRSVVILIESRCGSLSSFRIPAGASAISASNPRPQCSSERPCCVS
jgi:hypothetical protein